MNLDAALPDDTVRSEVLSLEMHVDRHVIFRAASTYGRNEIDGGDTTALFDQVDRFFGHKQIHASMNPI